MNCVEIPSPVTYDSFFTLNPQCEKLAILRQRLVARRRKRQQNEGSKLHHGADRLGILAENSFSNDSSSGEQHGDPDYYTETSMTNRADHQNYEQEGMQGHESEPNNDAIDRGSKVGDDVDDDVSIVDITLIECDCCKRSFAPKIYDKHFDSDGKPKCALASEKKRAVFNSAKVCMI